MNTACSPNKLESRRYLEVERYVSGTLFIGLGLTAAFAGSQKK